MAHSTFRQLPIKTNSTIVPPDPFQVIYQYNTSVDNSNYQLGVIKDSILYDTSRQQVTISGLLANDTPTFKDSNWLDWNGGADMVWLQIPVTSGVINGAVTICSSGNGDTFDGGAVERDNGVGNPVVYSQTYARLVIANVSSGITQLPLIQQQVTTYRMMYNQPMSAYNSNGSSSPSYVIPAAYPLPI